MLSVVLLYFKQKERLKGRREDKMRLELDPRPQAGFLEEVDFKSHIGRSCENMKSG